MIGVLLFALTTFIAPVGLLLIRTDMRRSSTVSTTEDHVLKGHTIRKQHTYDFLSCAQLCLAHQSCMSFNYQSVENGVCELNREVSPASISVALTSKRGYTFGHFVNISVSIIYFIYLFYLFYYFPTIKITQALHYTKMWRGDLRKPQGLYEEAPSLQ